VTIEIKCNWKGPRGWRGGLLGGTEGWESCTRNGRLTF